MSLRDKLAIVILPLCLAACGSKDAPQKGTAKTDDQGHSHDHGAEKPPHGGELLEIGDGAYHLELMHDHTGGNVTVWVLGPDAKTPVEIEAPVINLTKGAVQFTLTSVDPAPTGKSSAWKGSHDGLKVDPWDGRIRVKIGDKTFQSPLEGEAHSHDHK